MRERSRILIAALTFGLLAWAAAGVTFSVLLPLIHTGLAIRRARRGGA